MEIVPNPLKVECCQREEDGGAQSPVTVWRMLLGRVLSAADARLGVPMLPAVRFPEDILFRAIFCPAARAEVATLCLDSIIAEQTKLVPAWEGCFLGLGPYSMVALKGPFKDQQVA